MKNNLTNIKYFKWIAKGFMNSERFIEFQKIPK